MSQSMIHIDNLTVGYQQKVVLKDLFLDLNANQLTCLLGRNGSGKSTLIRSISGVQRFLGGQVQFHNRPISDYNQKELAKELSLVLTDNQAPGNLTVFALVALGRFPYTSWIGSLSKRDKEVIHWALEATGMLAFANRHMGELSDGEKQKVMIARALAQQTDLIILDEPTAHLDSPNRLEIFHLLKELVTISGRAILVSTHDIDTALHYADQLWLVNHDSIIAGLPEDLVINGSLASAFYQKGLHFDYVQGQFRQSSIEKGVEVSIEGDVALRHWLKNALERKGFDVVANASTQIKCLGNLTDPTFKITGKKNTYKTIEKLLIQLINGEN